MSGSPPICLTSPALCGRNAPPSPYTYGYCIVPFLTVSHRPLLLHQALCGRNSSSSDIYMMELALQKVFEATVASEPMMNALASAAYQSFLRAYAAHSKAEKRVRAPLFSQP